MDTTERGPRSPKVRPRELIQWAHPGVMGDVLRTLCLGAQSALHCPPPDCLGEQGALVHLQPGPLGGLGPDAAMGRSRRLVPRLWGQGMRGVPTSACWLMEGGQLEPVGSLAFLTLRGAIRN